MVDDLATTTGKPRRKGGGPSRAMASAQALIGVDLTAVDPVAILREIAADRSMPGSARVAACRVLLGVRDQDGPAADDAQAGAISVRALQLLKAARGH